MAEVKTRGKIDKWKTKHKYDIVAPDIFNNVVIGVTVSGDPKNLIGRTMTAPLSKLINSNQHHIKIKLVIENISGFNAETKVKEVEISGTYLGHQVSEDSSIIDHVLDVRCTDNTKARVKVIIFTKDKVYGSRKKELRALCDEEIGAVVTKTNSDQLIQEVIFGKLGSKIFNRGKKIVPLRRVEIRKLEIE